MTRAPDIPFGLLRSYLVDHRGGRPVIQRPLIHSPHGNLLSVVQVETTLSTYADDVRRVSITTMFRPQ